MLSTVSSKPPAAFAAFGVLTAGGGGPGEMSGGCRQRQGGEAGRRRGLKGAWKSIQLRERNVPRRTSTVRTALGTCPVSGFSRTFSDGVVSNAFAPTDSSCPDFHNHGGNRRAVSVRFRSDRTVALVRHRSDRPLKASPLQPGESLRRLSIDEAVKLALEQNLGIQIQRFDPQIQDTGIAQARSFWAPQFSTTFQKTSNEQPVVNIFSGTQPSVTTGQFFSGLTLAETLPWWGANYTANWNNSRFTTNDPTNTFNPRLQSNLSLNFTQPLLRNRSIDQIREQVASSRKFRDLSDIQLDSVIVQTTRAVRNAYWDLSTAINNLKAQQESLALAQQSLSDNRKRVEIGTLAPIDIVQAQAEVASNEERVIVAEAAIKRAQDNLRALILDPAATDFWTTAFEPSDAAPFQEQAIDIDAAVRNALDKRADLRAAKNSIERSDLSIRFLRNQILPDVNALVNYGARRHRRRAAAGEKPVHRRVHRLDHLADRARLHLGAERRVPQLLSRSGPSACRSATRSARARRMPTSSARGSNTSSRRRS